MVHTTHSTRPGNVGSPRRLSWDLIRVIALAAVVLFHSTYWGSTVVAGITPVPVQMPYQFGASTLLVISAFFAAETVRRHTKLRWFLRRLARLLPAYAVAVLMVFAAVHLFAPDDFYRPDVIDLIGNLFLLHLWITPVAWVDGSFWTLPVQVSAFAAIALLASVRAVRDRTVMLVLWTVVVMPLVVRVTSMRPEPAPWLQVLMEGSGLNRAHLFVAGVAVWMWARHRIGTPHLVLLLLTVLLAQKIHPPTEDSIIGLGVMLLLICLAARGPDWNLPGLHALTRPIRWVAGISYGVYLMHQTIGYLIARSLSDLGVSPWLSLAAFITAAILLGWALTVWVERPAFRQLVQWASSPRKSHGLSGS